MTWTAVLYNIQYTIKRYVNTTCQKSVVWHMYANGHLKFWFDKTVQEPGIIHQTTTISTSNKGTQPPNNNSNIIVIFWIK